MWLKRDGNMAAKTDEHAFTVTISYPLLVGAPIKTRKNKDICRAVLLIYRIVVLATKHLPV